MRDRHRHGSDADEPSDEVSIHAAIRGQECLAAIDVGSPHAIAATGQLDRTKFARLDMLVDTGATFSCIREDVADGLRLPSIGTANVLGVNSRRDCRIVSALLAVFPADRARPHVVPLIVADIGVPVIFGMPEIARGILVVDGRDGKWSWTVRTEDFGGRPAGRSG